MARQAAARGRYWRAGGGLRPHPRPGGRQQRYVVRAVAYALPPLMAVAGWLQLHEVGHVPGLLALAGITWVLWPQLVAGLVLIPACPAVLAPRRCRAWYRRRKRPRWGRWRGRSRWRHRGRKKLPAKVCRVVLAADRHRCVFCGARVQLQIDHIFPYVAGGLNCLINLATLCAACNRVKSTYRVAPDGYTIYWPFADADNEALAARILLAERRWRVSPWRLLRIAWVYG